MSYDGGLSSVLRCGGGVRRLSARGRPLGGRLLTPGPSSGPAGPRPSLPTAYRHLYLGSAPAGPRELCGVDRSTVTAVQEVARCWRPAGSPSRILAAAAHLADVFATPSAAWTADRRTSQVAPARAGRTAAFVSGKKKMNTKKATVVPTGGRTCGRAFRRAACTTRPPADRGLADSHSSPVKPKSMPGTGASRVPRPAPPAEAEEGRAPGGTARRGGTGSHRSGCVEPHASRSGDPAHLGRARRRNRTRVGGKRRGVSSSLHSPIGPPARKGAGLRTSRPGRCARWRDGWLSMSEVICIDVRSTVHGAAGATCLYGPVMRDRGSAHRCGSPARRLLAA